MNHATELLHGVQLFAARQVSCHPVDSTDLTFGTPKQGFFAHDLTPKPPQFLPCFSR